MISNEVNVLADEMIVHISSISDEVLEAEYRRRKAIDIRRKFCSDVSKWSKAAQGLPTRLQTGTQNVIFIPEELLPEFHKILMGWARS